MGPAVTTIAGPVGARRAHELGGQRLVAAAQEDDAVHRLAEDHLLGVHGHEVPEQHAGGDRKISPSEMVGNSSGRPPACHTPRLTASATSRRWRWHG
jgi:hypothetical protein